jgi:hypothetical protein
LKPLAALLLSVGLVWGIGSCRQVLGIEPAEEDRSLLPTDRAGSAGSTTTAHAAGGNDALALGGAGELTGGAGDRGGTRAGSGAGGATAGNAGASGEAGEGGAGGAGESPSLCEQYCTAVMQSCTEAFAVYTSFETCLAVCAAMPAGAPGDRNVNTVQCRLRAAQVARDEVPHYCPIAGPGGNGVCGSNCESLCQLRDQLCADYVTYDHAMCLSGCEKLKDLGSYSTDLAAAQYSGPHVQCRLYHVSAAAVDDAEQHCEHVDGAAPCR